MRRLVQVIVLAALLATSLALPASAHLTRWDTVRVIIGRNHTVVTAAAHGADLSGTSYAAAVERRLKLSADGKPVSPVTTHVAYDRTQDWVIWEGRIDGHVRIVRLVSPLIAGRDTAVVTFVDGRQVGQAIVSGHASAASTNPFGRMYVAGIVHILTGIDHIAFILLVLLGGAVGAIGGRLALIRIVKTLSLFTVAHSVSLALAAWGIWAPSARIVEPLIAASIVWQAVSVMRSTENGVRHQSLIVFGFGLVHGFGFAGGIAEIGFNRDFIVPSLLGFNLGIETGQLAVAAAVVPIMLWAARNRPLWHTRANQAAAVSLGLMGIVLVIQRVAGLS